MKYRVNQSDASCEVFEAAILFGGILAAIGITAAIQKINEWRDSKMSPAERVKKVLEKLSKNKIYEPDDDDFPSMYGHATVEECRSDMSGYWAPNPNTPKPVLETDAVPVGEYVKWAGKIATMVKALASMSSTDGAIKKIEALIKKTFGNKELEFNDSGRKLTLIHLKEVRHKWPTSEYYKDVYKAFGVIEDAMQEPVRQYKQLASKLEQVIKESTEGVSEEEMRDRVAYVEAAVLVTDIHNHLVESMLYTNIKKLKEIDVVWTEF